MFRNILKKNDRGEFDKPKAKIGLNLFLDILNKWRMI